MGGTQRRGAARRPPSASRHARAADKGRRGGRGCGSFHLLLVSLILAAGAWLFVGRSLLRDQQATEASQRHDVAARSALQVPGEELRAPAEAAGERAAAVAPARRADGNLRGPRAPSPASEAAPRATPPPPPASVTRVEAETEAEAAAAARGGAAAAAAAEDPSSGGGGSAAGGRRYEELSVEEQLATCRDGFVALTYASHGGRDDRFCRAMESAIRNGIDLHVLGWGVPWEGLAQKVTAARRVAAGLPEDCVVLFTDAFDVLFTDTVPNILRKFEAIGHPLVYSAECGCWPGVMVDRGRSCVEEYPPSPTPFRYLNSGSYIGRAATIASFLRAVTERAAERGKQGSGFHKLRDQELSTDMFLNGGREMFNMTLDYHTALFQTMHTINDNTLVPNCDPNAHLRNEDGVYINTLTKNQPAVFHFNGSGKKKHLVMEGKAWWKHRPDAVTEEAKEKVRSTELIFHDRRRRFDDVCPGYLK